LENVFNKLLNTFVKKSQKYFEPGLLITKWSWYPRKRRHSRWKL